MVFEETEAGIVIKPAEILASGALEDLSRAPEAKMIDLEELLERGRKRRVELIEVEY